MNISSPICPICGKCTSLCAPDRSTLGERFGINAQGISYYLSSYPKLLPYTVYNKSTYNIREKPPLTTDLTHYHTYIKKYSIVIIHDMTKALSSHNVIKRFNPDYSFRCKECGSKLSFNFNPFTLLHSWVMQLIMLISAVFVICEMINVFSTANQNIQYSSDAFYFAFAVLLAAIAVTAAYAIIGFAATKKYFSNIVQTNSLDEMINPTAVIKLSPKGLKKRFIHKANIFTADIDGAKYQLYLVDKTKSALSFSVCGLENETQRFINDIQNKPLLNLSFEGKSIGSAEIIAV